MKHSNYIEKSSKKNNEIWSIRNQWVSLPYSHLTVKMHCNAMHSNPLIPNANWNEMLSAKGQRERKREREKATVIASHESCTYITMSRKLNEIALHLGAAKILSQTKMHEISK